MHRDLVPAKLGQADVVPYLVDTGLIERSAVVHGRLKVTDASRRNLVHAVTSDGLPTYVVKQPRQAGDPGVAREAAVLRHLGALGGEHGLRDVLPVLVAYDERRELLVLEGPPGGQDLREHHARGRFSMLPARAAGQALALLHLLPADAVGVRPAGLDPAWPLSWHRPRVQHLFELSAGGVALLRLVQGSRDLCDALDDLRETWRPQSVIHGDVRWENCVAVPAPAARRRTRVLMVDWEMAGPGDPCLDVGAFLAEYLAAWVNSIPIVDSRDPARMLRHALSPLNRMQPALARFWAAYVTTSREHARERSLTRVVRFAAVRLLHAAVEQARDAGELRARTVCVLQLGLNLLRRPDEAAAHVLGLASDAGN